MRLITGLSGSRGYGSGNAVVKAKIHMELTKTEIDDPVAEIAKFRAAQEVYDLRLSRTAEEAEGELGRDAAEIFHAYRLIARDEYFFRGALVRVENDRINVEYAVFDECRKLLKHFVSIDDAYMRDRAYDIETVCHELINIMRGVSNDFSSKMSGRADVILVAENLTPAETVKLDKSVLRGIVTEHGGITSHTVILAKALGIPAIVGVAGATDVIRDGTFLLLDALRGEILAEPDDKSKRAFDKLKRGFDKRLKLFIRDARLPAVTKDGYQVQVTVNTGDLDSIKAFDPHIGDGVGLFRTEFIYLNSSGFPSEEEQFEIYKDLAVRAQGKPVIIRTLDVGGDRKADYMNIPQENNPFMGYRAIRYCLSRKDVFSTQLRAILRASAYGNVKVMFPMVVTPEEFLEARACLDAEKASLERDGIPYKPDIPVGTMIETPSAVLLSDRLAKLCDFFSIGSNDLIQYITASDRLNEHVVELYDSCNAAVLRAIRMVAENAAAAGISWSICGEVACEERLVPLWVAFGVSGLSVSPSAVGEIKRVICQLNRAKLHKVAEEALACGCADDARAYMDGFLNKLKKQASFQLVF